jgi:hypothetical protein
MNECQRAFYFEASVWATRTLLIPIFVVMIGSSQISYADVYRFVDNQGVAHFTDTPNHPGYTLFKKSHYTARLDKNFISQGFKVKFIRYLDVSIRSDHASPYDLSSLRNTIDYDALIRMEGAHSGLDPKLLAAVIDAESAANPNALSPKGAMGLMQLMPATAERFGVTNAFDPAQNIRGGAQYLAQLLKMFNYDVALALAAYNAGEGNVIRYGHQIPPFEETRKYVDKVITKYHR